MWLLLNKILLVVAFLLLSNKIETSSSLSSSSSKTMFRSTAVQAAQAASSQQLNLRVVSYNVLSSHLASPSHFSSLNPDHLDASARLKVVLQKLSNEISGVTAGSTGTSSERQLPLKPPTIVCLQEVSYDWLGEFHKFFVSKGYYCVCGNYGRKFNGYMGVCLAWPIHNFDVLNVDIARLSDKREGGWPPQEEKPALVNLWENVIVNPLRNFGLVEREQMDPYVYSERRLNVMVTATLRDKLSRRTFCISNYHMPCAFYNPPVMTIHADMCIKHLQTIAATSTTIKEKDDDNKSSSAASTDSQQQQQQQQNNLPYIAVGDWNIKPSDSVYKLLTTGRIDEDDPFYPPSTKNDENEFCSWAPTADLPVRSAYAQSKHGEPNFTNYARVRDEEPFIDTLDYIFLSKEWEVTNVLELPTRENAGGPFPNLDYNEPSDHILLAANLALGAKEEERNQEEKT